MHLLKFVDSIAAVPTTRLNLSDGAIWRVTSFDAPPPRLRRSMSQNAMTDGGFVSSSQYEMRTLRIGLVLNQSTQDANATRLQTLARELDRADNYLMYQPVGATKPVFFRTIRSDFTAIREMPTHATGAAMRGIEVEILAEPFALGLRETLGPYTVNNDPAAGSNPMSVSISGIKGDVPAPAVVVDTSAIRAGGVLAMLRPGLSFTPTQCEAMTIGLGTANPGGGPDAAMSGTGTNNYLRTTFSTTTMLDRVTTTALAGAVGRFRLYAIVRRSAAVSTVTARAVLVIPSGAGVGAVTGSTVTLAATTNRQLVDLGVFSTEETAVSLANLGSAPSGQIAFQAASSTASETLDWDAVFAIQSESLATWAISADSTTYDAVFDAAGEQLAAVTSGAAFSGSFFGLLPYVGSLPVLTPGVTSTLVYVVSSGSNLHSKSTTSALEIYYWPQYAYVRPATT